PCGAPPPAPPAPTISGRLIVQTTQPVPDRSARRWWSDSEVRQHLLVRSDANFGIGTLVSFLPRHANLGDRTARNNRRLAGRHGALGRDRIRRVFMKGFRAFLRLSPAPAAMLALAGLPRSARP